MEPQPPLYRPYGGPAAETSGRPGGVMYPGILRLGHWGANGWWRSLVGLISLVILVLLSQVVVVFGLMVYYLITGDSAQQASDKLGGDVVTPGFLLAVNLGWAIAIPIVWLLVRVLHGLKPRWSTSVRPGMRWGWFFVCLGLAFAALLATMIVGAALPRTVGTEISTTPNEFTSTTRDFLLVIILFTPLQAAGEEYVFRGYLAQAAGSFFGHPKVAATISVVVPAVLFAVAHGAQDPPIFFDRLAFGLVAGLAVLITGGLEAGIAMHVLNNFLAFGVALAFTDMTSSLNPTGGSWANIPVTLTQSLVYLGLIVWVFKLMGLDNRVGQHDAGRTAGAVLEPPRPPV